MFGTAPCAERRLQRSSSRRRLAAARRGPWDGTVEVGPLVEDRAGQSGRVVGGTRRPWTPSTIRPRLPGMAEATTGTPSAIASSRATLIPSSRRGSTNRSAARSSTAGSATRPAGRPRWSGRAARSGRPERSARARRRSGSGRGGPADLIGDGLERTVWPLPGSRRARPDHRGRPAGAVADPAVLLRAADLFVLPRARKG